MSTRSVLLAALALALASTACQPPAQEAGPLSEEDVAAIRGMLEKLRVDFVAEDWTAILSYFATDAVRMPPNESMIEGHAAITASFDALPPVTGFTLTPQVVAGEGDLAYARGAFTLDTAPPEAEPVNMVGKWLAIYERQADGSWLCVSDIWNTDTPLPEGG
jgi:ketosteroid isomerase-like protein